mgnify:FL=1
MILQTGIPLGTMYIGPWQEYKLAKLHKDAVQAIQSLTAKLPQIHAGGDGAEGLTAENVASVLAHFEDAMAGGYPRHQGRNSTARTSSSMPDINSHKQANRGDLRSARSTPSRSGSASNRVSRRRPSAKSTGKSKKSKQRYVPRAMREVNRRRELYMKGSPKTDATMSPTATDSRSNAGVKLPPIDRPKHTAETSQQAAGHYRTKESEGDGGSPLASADDEEDLEKKEKQVLLAAGDVDKLPDMDDVEVDGMLDWVKGLEDNLGDDLGIDFSDIE